MARRSKTDALRWQIVGEIVGQIVGEIAGAAQAGQSFTVIVARFGITKSEVSRLVANTERQET